MKHNFLLFGDNLWEAKSVVDNIVAHIGPQSSLKKINQITIAGCPAQPVYNLKYEEFDINITCLGNYELWIDKFPTVKRYIDFFDSPDAVLYSVEKDSIIAAGEFTDTVSVGNSQWQRAQRFVSAAILKIPFLGVYAFGEDRSQDTLREASALLTYSYLKLGIDSGIPLFLILKDSLYLNCHNKIRKTNGLNALTLPDGNEIIGKWFGLRLINFISPAAEMASQEAEMYQLMFDNLYYDVKNYSKTLLLVDKDLPSYHVLLPLKTRNLDDIQKVSFQRFCTSPWAISGKEINNSYFKLKVYPFIKNYFNTYNDSGKFAIADKKHSKEIESVLFDLYPPSSKQPWKHGLLDHNKPIVLISLQVWKKMGSGGSISYGYNDPNGGEAVLFPALLDSLHFNSNASIVYVYYGEYPNDWYANFNRNAQKIYRATNTIGKLLCVDNNSSDRHPESFMIIRRTI